MFRFAAIVALTLPVLSAQEPSSPGEPGFTLYTASQLVVLTVGVQDSHGANIKGLKAEDFKILEDGHPQAIKQFAAEDRPVTLGIVVDASGSMRTRQVEVATAALAFVRASNPQDETFVVNFNDRAFKGLPPALLFSNDPMQLRAALLGPQAAGRTALYDALTLAAGHLAKGKWENKVLLLISDGGDNNSTHTFADTVQALQRSGATVYSIALYDPDEREHNLGILRRLAKMSGGEAFEPMNTAAIAPLCLRIAADIRASYTLAYTPPQSDRHAASRKIKVAVIAPHEGKPVVRTRTSYFPSQNGHF
ncbi:MAG: VWA domain-containing protein [Acidobacteriota bacterium]|nr:VWA domain-containing protein [Acidobacteriota bacterium]